MTAGKEDTLPVWWHCPVIAFARRLKHRHGVKGGTAGGRDSRHTI